MNTSFISFFIRIIQGSLIGLGAVLPGLSGGVLCMAFGIYQPLMEVLGDPIHRLKEHLRLLIPVALGAALGFLGIANLLSFFLEQYPEPSVSLFVGLIAGMLPSLFRDAGKEGHDHRSFGVLLLSMVLIFLVLVCLKVFHFSVSPGFAWYLFCGCCLALSVLVPGMSFSTLLMPLNLYEPFVSGIGNLDMTILIPAGIGALLTIVCLSRLINRLFQSCYPLMFHAIIGIVIGATIMIIPFRAYFTSPASALLNVICLGTGLVLSLLLDHFNQKVGACSE